MPGFVAFVQRTVAPAATAVPKDWVPGWTPTVAPVGGVTVAAAAAATPAHTVDRAATAAAREEAAPGWHAGGSAAGGRTGSEVRDGALPGTVESQVDKWCETDSRMNLLLDIIIYEQLVKWLSHV